MADSLPVFIQMGALPPDVKWKPQQLADAMVARMRLVTAQTFALFVSGSTEPTSNVGPWLRGGTEWWVWSDTAGAYVPITVPSESLGYYIGSVAPDQNTTNFWIQTDDSGSPLALKIYYSGAWTDVYAAQFADYLTIAAAASTYAPLASPTLTGTPTVPTAAPGTNTTQAASTAFVQAAVGGIVVTPFAAYPAQGVASAQTVPADGTSTKVALASAPINPAPAPFDTAQNRYVAPAAGYYRVDFSCQFDNVDATPATMEIIAGLFKNGVLVGNGLGDTDGTPSPNGDRWSPSFSGIVQLAANDYLEVFVEANDGVGTGDVTLTVAQLSVTREQAV
jgi:hypothetical protein